jgi:hypothetical protein
VWLLSACVLTLVGTVACDSPTPTVPAGTTSPGTTLVSGTVLHTETRAPIAGAVVTVRGQISPAPRSVVTNGDGTFRMEAVLNGIGTITAEAAGFQLVVQDLTVTGAEVRTELALVPSAPPPAPDPTVTTVVRGLVTNRVSNLPITGATVTITLATGERFAATTGNDGLFILTNVEVGATADLRVEATRYWPYDQRLVVETNQNLTIRLDPTPGGDQ